VSERKRTVIAVCVALMIGLVTAILAVVIIPTRSYMTSWGEEIPRGEKYLRIDGQTLTQEDLEHIAGLRRLTYLELTNCNVAECRLPEVHFVSRNLYRVDLSGTKGLWDLGFLGELPASTLCLSDCPGVDDLSKLNWDVLDDLTVDGTEVTNLLPVADSNLSYLSFARTEVSDITPLARAEGLWRIDGSHTHVSDLGVLTQLPWLFEISFDGCPIDAIPAPFEATYLHEVSLADTQVSDLSGLSGCAELKELDLSGCSQLKDMDWLASGCRETLEALNLSRSGLDAEDVQWVAACHGLRSLGLDGIALESLELCKGMRNLEHLSVVGCGLTSAAGIEGCTSLTSLLLGYNQLESLKGIPMPRNEWPTFVLDVSHNGLQSYADLPRGKYQCLLLHGNEVDAANTIPRGVSTYELTTNWFAGAESSKLREYDRFSELYFVGCPKDEVATVENTFGPYRAHCVTESELWDLLESDELDYKLFLDLGDYVAFARETEGQSPDLENEN